MKNGNYESDIGDIRYLLEVASPVDLQAVAILVGAKVGFEERRPRFVDATGADLSMAEILRRSQAEPTVQRRIYNMWMTYAH